MLNLSVESLHKVHAKWKALDSLHDERIPSTVRRAWREVRDGLERGLLCSAPHHLSEHIAEADTRRALFASMKNDVLSPLITLKVIFTLI
jgi:hypothetical protein